jgi:hypothetical protein
MRALLVDVLVGVAGSFVMGVVGSTAEGVPGLACSHIAAECFCLTSVKERHQTIMVWKMIFLALLFWQARAEKRG